MKIIFIMRINWSKLLFLNVRRRRKNKIIGHDIVAKSRYKGRFFIIDGLCISMKSKKSFLVTSSFCVKKFSEINFLIRFPMYLSGAFMFKVVGLTYGFKTNCSKLTEARLKE